MALAAGTRLGPYEVLAPLGAGGMGEVYRARDQRLGRDVAIRSCPTPWRAPGPPAASSRRRARPAPQSPGILDVHDVGSHQGLPYLVFELLEGQTLRGALAAGHLPSARHSIWRCRSPTAWRPPTTRASSTATSSPPTCS